MSEQTVQITALTPEQEAQIEVYREKYRQIGLSTKKTDREKAEKAVLDSYLYLGLEKPEFIWADDPFHGAVLAAQYAKGSTDVTDDEVKAQARSASYGSFEAYWVSFYAYIAEVLPIKADHLHKIATSIVEECGVYWTFEGLVIMTEKPTEIHIKDAKLHNTSGPAIKYASGRGIYAVNGVRKNSLMEAMLEMKYGTE